MTNPRSHFSSAILPAPRGNFLIGVSGGADSVALLAWLAGRKYRLTVCHLDHGLRPGAKADARFVERLATQFECPFLSDRVPVRPLAKERKESIETAGREARYQFFARCAEKTGCRRLFLGHHADDQVETFLANLFRGSGAAGLAGMRPKSQRRIGQIPLTLLRPFLPVWRTEIEAYLGERAISFRHDDSNDSLRFTRNRLRHQIIPLLEEYFGRAIRENLWRTAEVLAAEDEILAREVGPIGARLSVMELRKLPVALQRRTVRAWLLGRGISNVGFREIESVRALLAQPPMAPSVNLSRDRQVRRRAGALFIPRRAPGRLA